MKEKQTNKKISAHMGKVSTYLACIGGKFQCNHHSCITLKI